jgi:beta-galactosidase/beta-glucuronidase
MCARIPLVLFVSILPGLLSAAPWRSIELSSGWMIKQFSPRAALDAAVLDEAVKAPDSAGWLPAPAMPAMVHDILLHHKKIETPWLPGRAEMCRWVAEQDWIYATRFTAPGTAGETWLRFTGLDTIVDVYLNGRRIASHSNMYLPLEVEIGRNLRRDNSLVLHFHAIFEKAGSKPVPLRAVNGGRVRRPAQNYGNYLGPQPFFSRVGVYDRVFLQTTGGNRMVDVVAGASLNEPLTEGTVALDISGQSRSGSLEVRVRVLDPEGKVAAASSKPVRVIDGAFSLHDERKVTRPRLWWPRGYGGQPLYRVEIELIVNGQVHQTEQRTLGFRHVAMSSRLHFLVNGVPIRWWGGDWVTPHWQTAVWDQPRVEKLFQMAEHANFNAFRVWGVVESPRNEFYELAAARGFILWQDFTDLPLGDDDSARAACRREAVHLLKRLKHYPSIFVWCGGNEAAMWHHQEFHSNFENRGPWPGLVAAEDVAALFRQLDPERYYQPSSPYYGIDPNDPQEGNTHGYTNMWFVPGYDYLNFASEDTRIAAPVLHSLRRFFLPEDIWPSGYTSTYKHGDIHPYPKSWLKHTTSHSWRKTGPVEQFYDATDAASLVYRLGMAEALYYQDTVERQRRGRDAADPTDRRRCGGYIVWKYNDSWPQVYSAKVDYFLEPYHAYYQLRRSYTPVLLSFDAGAYIYVWVVNDSRDTVIGTVRIQLFHLDRNIVRKEIVREVEVAPGKSAVVVRLDQAGIGTFHRDHILYATFTDKAGRILARANAYGDIERRVTFPDARLNVRVDGGALTITTDKFARAVHLEGDAAGEASGWFFEDNYFDLMPGEVKTVRVLGSHTSGRISAKAWYSPHTATVAFGR